MKLLIVEDDALHAEAAAQALVSGGFKTQCARTAEEGLAYLGSYDFALVVLDLNLPDMHGLELIREMRSQRITTPVLALTKTDDTTTKVGALRCGADDYVVKPFQSEELVERCRAIIRRHAGAPSSIIKIGPLAVDMSARVAGLGGQATHLTGKEFQILELLLLRRGRVVGKEAIMNHLYGGRDEPEIKIIDVFVCKLRGRLRAAGVDHLIETVWGRGYMIRAEDAA